MLAEVCEYYYNSVRKAVLDYVLKNDEDKYRLGLMDIFEPVLDYGDNFYKGIEPDMNWKNAVIQAREELYDQLVKYNDASLEIMRSNTYIF